jgi:hypothetical protein
MRALLALALVAGCDPQVGQSYRGEPMATLQGTVEEMAGPISGPVDAALLWTPRGVGSVATVPTPIPVEKMFLAHFVMTIVLPPPVEVLQPDVVAHAEARVAAIARGATADDLAQGRGLYGYIDQPRVHFFEADLPPKSLLARQYGAVMRGYHLVNRTQIADPSLITQAQVDACVADLMANGFVGAGQDTSAAATLCRQQLLVYRQDVLPLDTSLVLKVPGP